ncbi:MAG: MOSC domain-containing protein [Candidatus Thermoplasmatota archaeon]|nr:MOSC domain-containing protein [Candidatus Thermoplasmatota archaeon]
MTQGSVVGLFATTVGGVPKPSVESIEVRRLGIKDEVIRDKKHHGGAEKAVCLLSQDVLQQLQNDGHPIAGGSTGENILIDVPFESLRPGVQLKFHEVELEITMAASPCKTIGESFIDQNFNELSDKKYPGRTRWYARVLVEGFIHEDETVTINSIA